MTIKFADQRIREVRQRIAALDRELAQLPKAFLTLPVDDPMAKELRAAGPDQGNRYGQSENSQHGQFGETYDERAALRRHGKRKRPEPSLKGLAEFRS